MARKIACNSAEKIEKKSGSGYWLRISVMEVTAQPVSDPFFDPSVYSIAESGMSSRMEES